MSVDNIFVTAYVIVQRWPATDPNHIRLNRRSLFPMKSLARANCSHTHIGTSARPGCRVRARTTSLPVGWRPQQALPDAGDHDSNRTWDGCAQLDVSPLTLHQAPCTAVDARDHRGRAEYAAVARPGRLSAALIKPAAARLLAAADACGTGAGWQQWRPAGHSTGGSLRGKAGPGRSWRSRAKCHC